MMDKKKEKAILKMAVIGVLGVAVLYEPTLLVNAATNTKVVTNKFNVLQDIVTAIVSCLGEIITLWGISEWGMAYQGQDGMMQAHAFKRVGGGVLMILAPQILKLF